MRLLIFFQEPAESSLFIRKAGSFHSPFQRDRGYDGRHKSHEYEGGELIVRQERFVDEPALHQFVTVRDPSRVEAHP